MCEVETVVGVDLGDGEGEGVGDGDGEGEGTGVGDGTVALGCDRTTGGMLIEFSLAADVCQRRLLKP